jgi:hypothetical protein
MSATVRIPIEDMYCRTGILHQNVANFPECLATLDNNEDKIQAMEIEQINPQIEVIFKRMMEDKIRQGGGYAFLGGTLTAGAAGVIATSLNIGSVALFTGGFIAIPIVLSLAASVAVKRNESISRETLKQATHEAECALSNHRATRLQGKIDILENEKPYLKIEDQKICGVAQIFFKNVIECYKIKCQTNHLHAVVR